MKPFSAVSLAYWIGYIANLAGSLPDGPDTMYDLRLAFAVAMLGWSMWLFMGYMLAKERGGKRL